MSQESPEPEGEPRRGGGRSRKQVERYDPGPRNKGKERAEEEDHDDDQLSASDEEETRPLSNNRRAANGVRKPRTSKGGRDKPKKKPRTSAVAEGQPAGALPGLKDDCALFNALLSPDIALQPLIEDWVETYQSTANDEVSEKASIQELVLFLVRCCGLSADVDEDEAVDTDGVLDVIERIQDESVKHVSADYPLISRQKALKPFRTNLDMFVSHLITTLSLTPILYATPENTKHSSLLTGLILTWLHSMSSSPLRPIRHTSTYITLKINSALCDVAVQVNKDLSLAQRQREHEGKKGGVGAAYQKRLKDAEGRVAEQHERKMKLEEFMQETFDVVFVHRVRDADPTIRTDCLKELGQWVKKYPEHYVSTGYLNYFTRGCNDPNSHARLETVKALVHLFDKKNTASNARTVTLRLAPRLIEMALRDVDLSVRVNALHVVSLIDSTGVLADEDDEQRAKVARLVFDHEPRVRKAVGGFFHGLWDERYEQLKGEGSSLKGNKKKRAAALSDVDLERNLGYKALAQLLVETATALDEDHGEQPQVEGRNLALPTQSDSMTRATAAIEALWGDFDMLQDWRGLAAYLLLDHSTHDQDMWLSDEGEEGLLTQLLIACVRHEDKEEDEDEKSKALMNILPRLLSKNQAYPSRLAGVLSMVEKMNLGLYLDMRMNKQYNSLWDDITKLFLQQTDVSVLTAAIQAINLLCSNTSMSTANNSKLAELEESLFSSLRDAIHGEDVTMMSIDEDQRISFEAVLLRLTLLGRSRDLTDSMLDEEGGQTSGWDIVTSFAERGKTGWKEEVKIVEYATQAIFLSLTWLFKSFEEGDAGDEGKISDLKDKRDRALEVYDALGLRDNNNAVESVRRQAIISYINVHMLFSTRSEAPAAKACSISMPDEKQHKLGGAFEAALEAYAESRREPGEDEAADEEEDQTSQDFLFLQLTSVMVGAIRCGVLDIDHAPIPLTHYGRYGPTYDAIVRRLVDVLRDEGIYNNQAQTVVNIASDALQRSFQLYLDDEGSPEDPTSTASLAKLLSTAFVINGTHFTVLRQIHPSDVADFHVASLDYVLNKIGDLIRRERQQTDRKQKIRVARLRVRVLTYFRALVLLLGPVTAQDALKLRSHLQEGLGRTGATLTTHDQWKAYEAYEKRLISIAGKDEEVRKASKKVAQQAPKDVAKKQAPVAREEVMEDEEEEGEEEETEERETTPTPVEQGRSKQHKRARQEVEEGDEEEGEDVNEVHEEGHDGPSMDVDVDAEFDDFDAQQAKAVPALKRRRTGKR